MKLLTLATALVIATGSHPSHAAAPEVPAAAAVTPAPAPIPTPEASTAQAMPGALPAAAATGSTGSSAPPAPVAPVVPTVIKPRMVTLTVEGLTQRYESLGNLIERSSSAKQLEKSGTPEAMATHQQAKDTRARAKEAIAAGELEKADALLREASQTMMKAVRMAHPEEVTGQKAKTDFNNRRESVNTLLATGKRVAGEKGAARPEFVKAEELVKEADTLGAQNKYAEGKTKLDMAYLLVKDSLRDMRGGEQLTADKNFATKADEFKYEQARNDDYMNLISGVISGKSDDPSWEEMAKKARALREEADALGKSGDHEAALRVIGESTKQLKNILRRSGFPIV